MDNQDKTLEEQNLDQLAAAFGDHQITGTDGEMLAEEPATQETAAEETNTEEETATAEKPAESEEEAPALEAEDETNFAEDESGKRYVPEKRLKKETAKRREAERRAQALEAAMLTQPTQPVRQEAQPSQPVSPTDDVETEVLFTKYPQFDKDSDQYSEPLDSLGYQIYKANPGISRLKAAKLAIEQAKKLTADQAQVVAEARTVKAQQSDQGITSRVLNRSTQTVDPNKMSLEEKEEWLRANGEW